MGYKVLNNRIFKRKDYSIVSIRESDKFQIMHWRNAQIGILRQKEPLTEQMQSEYFETVVKLDFNSLQPKQILVSYLYKGELIGYGGLVHIQWMDSRAEVSFLLCPERNNNVEFFKQDYGVFLTLIKQLAFNELKLKKLTTEAFDVRPYLIETLEKNGFVLEGRLKDHNFINGKFVDSLLHGCFSKAS
jgi:RimJ/RimL family protein N-acetyltransferase